ncbi:MAG: response regulator [Spirochaetia bacterium]|jgi:CheY-like chemotaxis protein
MCRVLIVEDNPLNLELARDLLEAAGFEVISAKTAKEGLEQIRLHLPDLVLLDIALPDMDGLEAVRRIKADPVLAAIPVVALSAHAMTRDRDLALKAGCDGYITKPIDTRKFAPEVSSYSTARACA